MNHEVPFRMDGYLRKSLIEGHKFYVDQARQRLLSQFENIESEADKASDEWLERSSSRFDPDRDDPSDFYEGATDAGIKFYELLSGMRDQTYLSVVAGMFHEWDKQLRGWLVYEVQHWDCSGENLPKKIWLVNFEQISELLESFGWEICCADYFKTLNACRLVVNVYKHGKGASLDKLKEGYPEYFSDPLNGMECSSFDSNHLDHTHLKVNGNQLQAFSDAIVEFWQAVPENRSYSESKEVPDWFEKAFLKDANGQQ